MKISKEELKDLYENNTTVSVCEKLGISIHTLMRLLDKAGIDKKGRGGGLAAESGRTKIELV